MTDRIEAADNQKLKLVRKLRQKKHRDSLGKFIIEGINLLEEACDRNADIDFVIASEDFDSSRLYRIKDSIGEWYIVSREMYEKLSDAENGSGVMAVVSRNKDYEEILSEINSSDNILVLDRVQDPGNIGTMIRTAVAAGYKAIMLIKGSADVYSPKVLRATAGMIFDIPLLFSNDASEAVDILHGLGLRVCVTEPEASTPYFEAELSKGIALVIGNEGRGISDEFGRMADERITLPMEGTIESLNAAVAAAIIMYERIRNNHS